MTPATAVDETDAPRSRKGERTRARLVAAAREVFERTGFLEARVSDIAEAAGLSHGAFYHYFDSKEQIFREVAEELEAALTRVADEEADADATAPGGSRQMTSWERILRANRRYLERYRDNAGSWA